VTLAPNLKGDLLLIVGELDTNVDPASTMQVVSALIKADKLVHLLAPVASVNGVVQAGVVGQGSDTDGRILFNVGSSLAVAGGFVTSNGDIHLNAGVDMAWSRQTLEGTIDKSALIGGSISITGKGRLSAENGSIVIQAGGDVTLDADSVVPGSRSVDVQRYTTVAETVTKVIGYEQVATGTVQVPVVTWETTQITEIV
jgi:hypothetical protein